MALAPEKASSHYNLGLACWENGKAADALSAFRRTLDLDPGLERARFLVETLSGEPRETVPREFVKAMYDTHAYRFDVNLVDELQYQIPTDAREAVRDLWGDPDGRSWVISTSAAAPACVVRCFATWQRGWLGATCRRT